jgi:hypothetical protein
MKQSVMKKWVKALRSGKYKQGEGCLKNGNEYCCLGVLSAISPYKNNFTKMCDVSGDKNLVLPQPIQNWSGMESDNGKIDGIADSNLVGINDNGTSFKEIADFIEKHWEKL